MGGGVAGAKGRCGGTGLRQGVGGMNGKDTQKINRRLKQISKHRTEGKRKSSQEWVLRT